MKLKAQQSKREHERRLAHEFTKIHPVVLMAVLNLSAAELKTHREQEAGDEADAEVAAFIERHGLRPAIEAVDSAAAVRGFTALPRHLVHDMEYEDGDPVPEPTLALTYRVPTGMASAFAIFEERRLYEAIASKHGSQRIVITVKRDAH